MQTDLFGENKANEADVKKNEFVLFYNNGNGIDYTLLQ